MKSAQEANFDGIVGPTHNYAGLSYGNVASTGHAGRIANPKHAALEGLAKMKFLADRGLVQGVLPPHDRPDMAALRSSGFSGTDAEIIAAVAKTDPTLLSIVSSASSMWTANAATVSPSADSTDGKVHFTPANLLSKAHRTLEPSTTGKVLKRIFGDEKFFRHHPPLVGDDKWSDEGAANHNRLAKEYGEPGLQIFVYGRKALDTNGVGPKRFPARQTFEASSAIARNHCLRPDKVIFVQQHPDVIDAGVFHNDVISVSNRNIFLYHERAFLNGEPLYKVLKNWEAIVVRDKQVPIAEAVKTYLFNSQLVSFGDALALVAPRECQESKSVNDFISGLLSDGKLGEVHFQNLRQSMQNGGGPACLRLRVVLTDAELRATHAGALLTPPLYTQLTQWVEKHYRDRLSAEDLADPSLLQESRTALDQLTQILKLGTIYDFQQG